MKSNKFLFDVFPPVSEKQWKQKIQFDLKGRDYAELITHTLEGIAIKPFYHQDSYRALPFHYTPATFRVVHYYDFIPSGKNLKFSKKNAADLVRFIARKPFKINSKEIPHFAELHFHDESFIEKLIQKNQFFHYDPVSHLIRTGNWFQNEKKDLEFIDRLTGNQKFKLLIDTAHLQNAGANTVQQIAYGLAHAYVYFQNTGEKILPHIQFKTATGYNYFFEIAKIKALRYLWKEISGCEEQPLVFSTPSLRNKTVLSPYVNMIRTGMEMMASVLGGADEIANLPYNYVFKKWDENAFRLASNQLILLKEEARFEQMKTAAEGSYYIEEIAVQMAEKALDIFKQIQEGGGYLKQLYDGNIQRKIKENASKEQKLFDEGKLILTGINKFIQQDETVPERDKNPFMKENSNQKTLIRKIIPRRLAETIEVDRIKKLKEN